MTGGTAAVLARVGPVRQCVASHPVPADRPVTLAVDIRAHRDPGLATGPDTLAFSVETSEGAVRLARLDGRHLSTQVATGFTGRVLGIEWFDHAPGTSCTTP